MTEDPGLEDPPRRPRRVAGTVAVVVAVGALAVLTSDAIAPPDRLTVTPGRDDGGGRLVVAEDGPAPPSREPSDVALPDEVIDPAWAWLADAPLSPRDEHPLVWTGTEAITWGGLGPVNSAATEAPGPDLPVRFDGAAYDPATDRWRLIALAPLGFVARTGHVAVWSGRELLVWGAGTPTTPASGTAPPTTRPATHGGC